MKINSTFLTHWLLSLFILFFSVRAQADAGSEIKALFIYNFANFVDWPAKAFKSTDAPLQICLYGQVRFETMLQQFAGTPIGTHELQITQTDRLEQIQTGCHILFVAEDRLAQLPDFFNQIQYLYVLSVGEQSAFTSNGGIINMFRTEDQMSFDINLDAATSNGLVISSDLLALARQINR